MDRPKKIALFALLAFVLAGVVFVFSFFDKSPGSGADSKKLSSPSDFVSQTWSASSPTLANAPQFNPPVLPAGPSIADVLEGVDLRVPGERERVVAEIQKIEEARREAGRARAKELGMPLRVVRPDGTVQEVAGIDELGQVVYFITHNTNAAISTGANLLNASPYNLTGSGIVVGVWDGGAGRAAHQEFGGRLVVMDGAALNDHATHVAGTVIASGVVANAKGMAPSANVDSYDWNNDKTEMTTRGAAAANESGKIFLSNHSYGYASGWNLGMVGIRERSDGLRKRLRALRRIRPARGFDCPRRPLFPDVLECRKRGLRQSGSGRPRVAESLRNQRRQLRSRAPSPRRRSASRRLRDDRAPWNRKEPRHGGISPRRRHGRGAQPRPGGPEPVFLDRPGR